MDDDPISQFFPGQENVDLYEVLSLKEDAKLDDIKKAYRRLALLYHPDKHANGTAEARATASIKFQQIGFAYAVLSDSKKRERYDTTGRTDEVSDLAGEDGWDAYFEAMFERVTRGKLDEMKKKYQGSSEEIDDLKAAYQDTGGSIGDIMMQIPHSTHDDEARFIVVISDLIKQGALPSLERWDTALKDEKAQFVRGKKAEKEAKEAEELAKELGVWDDFYGSSSPGGKKKPKGSRGKGGVADGEVDHSALQALISKKRKKTEGFFDALIVKYAGSSSPKKGKKRERDDVESQDDNTAVKKSRSTVQLEPDIDDDEFLKLQKQLFNNKEMTDAPSKSRTGITKARKK